MGAGPVALPEPTTGARGLITGSLNPLLTELLTARCPLTRHLFSDERDSDVEQQILERVRVPPGRSSARRARDPRGTQTSRRPQAVPRIWPLTCTFIRGAGWTRTTGLRIMSPFRSESPTCGNAAKAAVTRAFEYSTFLSVARPFPVV